MTSIKQKNKDKAAKKEVMASLRAKNAAAKGEGGSKDGPVELKEWKMSSTMSGEEFKSHIREMFDSADANHDQVLELGEFKQFSLFVLTAMAGLNLAES